jgi:hypothetical protein
MKPLFTEEEFNKTKSDQKLPCKCYHCNGIFYSQKKEITRIIKNKTNNAKYCSLKCTSESKITKKTLKCLNCSNDFYRMINQIKKSKNHFCSHSCSTTYNNKHKTFGTRRSKLEKYIEEQLTLLYSNLEILYNNKEIINSELDIYIPKLKLAFELNGIFHFEPIFGNDKLDKVKNNDNNKFKLCIEQGISLCIIDTSQQKYVKPTTSQKYLNIICDVINQTLLIS